MQTSLLSALLHKLNRCHLGRHRKGAHRLVITCMVLGSIGLSLVGEIVTAGVIAAVANTLWIWE